MFGAGQPRRLVVLKPGMPGRLAIDASGEHQTVLQALVSFAFDTTPAQRIGQQAGKHRDGGKRADDAVVVDGLAAAGHQRRLETHDEMFHMDSNCRRGIATP